MKRKRVLAAIMAAVMVLGLTACSAGTKDAKDKGEDKAASTSDGESVGVGEGEVVTIWECNWGGDNYEATLKKLAEEATEANIDGKGYKVEVSMVAWDNYYETFMTAVTAGTAPDIACEASTSPYNYDQMGETLDLTPLYDEWVKEGSDIAKEIPQAAWDFEKNKDGELIALPFAVDGPGVVYNKEIFEKAGIKDMPETWDDFKEICGKILDNGVTPVVFEGDSTAFVTNVADLFCSSNDTGSIDMDYNPLITSEKNQEVYSFVEELFQKGYIPEGISGYDQSDARRIFLDNEAGMLITGAPSFIGNEDADKYGVLTPFHGPSADSSKTATAYQAYYAFNQSDHPEATLAVLKWWYENNDILWTEGGNSCIPITKSKMERVITSDLVSEFATTWSLSEDAVPGIYPLTSFQPFSAAVDSEGISAGVLEAIFAGGDIKEASEKTTKELEEIVEEYAE